MRQSVFVIPTTLILSSVFWSACIEAPPEDLDPNNVSENNTATNNTATNNTATNNTATNNTVTNNTATNNTATNNTATNNSTNNQTNNTTNNTTNNQTGGMYTVTLTPSRAVPGALNVPLYVAIEDSNLPAVNFALEHPMVFTETDSIREGRAGFWVRWPDLGSLTPITFTLDPNGSLLDRQTWDGHHAVWHLRNGQMLMDSTQNPTTLAFENCTTNCRDIQDFVGVALKTKGYAALSTDSTINLANNWSVSLWIQIPSNVQEITGDFFSMIDPNQNGFILGIDLNGFMMKTGESENVSVNNFGPIDSARNQTHLGWHHIAIKSNNGVLSTSINGATFNTAPSTAVGIQGQVNIRLGNPQIPFGFDEVWIGNTSEQSLNVIYLNQAQALPVPPIDALRIDAQLSPP